MSQVLWMHTVVYKTDMFFHLIKFILQLGKPKENKHLNTYFNCSKYKEETLGESESKEQRRLFCEIIFKLRLK